MQEQHNVPQLINLCSNKLYSLTIIKKVRSRKMSIFPSLFNRQFNIFDPFQGLIFSSDDNSETQMDWKETPKSHVFEFDLPGLTKDDVKLEVHQGRVLYISGERKEKEEETDDHKRSGDKWHCLERSRGKFMRQFQLPENAKADDIKAVMENGVLTVTVPKDEVKKKVKNTIVEISGDDEERPNSKGLGRFVCFKA